MRLLLETKMSIPHSAEPDTVLAKTVFPFDESFSQMPTPTVRPCAQPVDATVFRSM